MIPPAGDELLQRVPRLAQHAVIRSRVVAGRVEGGDLLLDVLLGDLEAVLRQLSRGRSASERHRSHGREPAGVDEGDSGHLRVVQRRQLEGVSLRGRRVGRTAESHEDAFDHRGALPQCPRKASAGAAPGTA